MFSPSSIAQPETRRSLSEHYQQVRQASEQLCQPLVIEDYGIQSMPDVSPPRWHLFGDVWEWTRMPLRFIFGRTTSIGQS